MVTGISRVISGPEEFHKLRQGEILIAPLTNPVWTPLFAVAGGLITEVGGILPFPWRNYSRVIWNPGRHVYIWGNETNTRWTDNHRGWE